MKLEEAMRPDSPLTDQDRTAISDFQRFLKRMPPAPVVSDQPFGVPRRNPRRGVIFARIGMAGWIPYVLGVGPAPPEGMDAVHVTAWTFPC